MKFYATRTGGALHNCVLSIRVKFIAEKRGKAKFEIERANSVCFKLLESHTETNVGDTFRSMNLCVQPGFFVICARVKHSHLVTYTRHNESAYFFYFFTFFFQMGYSVHLSSIQKENRDIKRKNTAFYMCAHLEVHFAVWVFVRQVRPIFVLQSVVASLSVPPCNSGAHEPAQK